MAETPSVAWQGAAVMEDAGGGTNNAAMWGWTAGPSPAGTLPMVGASPGTISISVGEQLRVSAATIGSLTTVTYCTVTITQGSCDLAVAEGFADLLVGMWVAPVAGLIPNGLQIVSLDSGAQTVVLGGEAAMAEIVAGASPADASGVFTPTFSSAAAFYAADAYPYGTLALSVTPSTGTTLVDWDFDGTTNDDHVGNGTAASNSGGQALGDFGVTFADSGTYSVSCAYTSSDALYSDATVSPKLTVVVS